MTSRRKGFITGSLAWAKVGGYERRMTLHLPLLIALMLAAAPPAAAPEDSKIVVTGNRWAPFISPMGEPFRSRITSDNTLANWFHQADRNQDGALTVEEMQADADRFFLRLDSSGDGAIDPDELVHYEWEVAPDVQLNSRTRLARGAVAPKPEEAEKERRRLDRYEDPIQGAARYSLLNMPQPVAAADRNFDRSITAAEFRSAATYRFQLLDSAGSGRLTLPGLEQQLAAQQKAAGKRDRKRRKDEDDTRIGNPL